MKSFRVLLVLVVGAAFAVPPGVCVCELVGAEAPHDADDSGDDCNCCFAAKMAKDRPAGPAGVVGDEPAGFVVTAFRGDSHAPNGPARPRPHPADNSTSLFADHCALRV